MPERFGRSRQNESTMSRDDAPPSGLQGQALAVTTGVFKYVSKDGCLWLRDGSSARALPPVQFNYETTRGTTSTLSAAVR